MSPQRTSNRSTARTIAYVGLFLTCLTPAAAGVYRCTTLLLETSWLPRLLPDRADHLPLFVHVAGAMTFYLLAAAQVVPGLRKRHPRWHRLAGRIAAPAGVASAVAATWITLVHPDVSGPILYAGRLLFGPLWAGFLILGVLAARRRDTPAHRDWMIRAFAVAMPAGTLVFISLPFFVAFGSIELPQALDEGIQSGAWVVHLAVAELVIRRMRSTRPKHLKETDQHESAAPTCRCAVALSPDDRLRRTQPHLRGRGRRTRADLRARGRPGPA